MKFCASCGSALEFFEFLDGELCSNCLRNAQSTKQADPVSASDTDTAQENFIDMDPGVLSVENGKLVLKSTEGWILWSGSAHETHQLTTVLERARHILKIRRKRRT